MLYVIASLLIFYLMLKKIFPKYILASKVKKQYQSKRTVFVICVVDVLKTIAYYTFKITFKLLFLS